MPIKKYNPITPTLRTRATNAFAELTTDKPQKSLLAKIKSSGGRNNTGKMTVRYRGGGVKRQYRVVDFKRDKDEVSATVKTVEYDPNRSAFICLIEYTDGVKDYIIAPQGLKVGTVIKSGKGVPADVGNTMILSEIPIGLQVHNIEFTPGKGAAIARSAGSYATLAGKEERYAVLKMPSGEIRRVLIKCRATVGVVSNADHSLRVLGKAGAARWAGRRPHNRGVVMNPVDHPMGGGEGRASGGHPRSRNGQFAKGLKTRNPNARSNKLIVSRRKTGK